MRKTVILLILLAGFSALVSAKNRWKPGKAPLATEWAQSVTPENAWREYPRPTMVRSEWMNLNGLWDYSITESGMASDKFVPDGKLLVPYPVESSLSGVTVQLHPGELLKYRRTVVIPQEWRGKRIILNFEAVDYETEVRVNGTSVGNHKGGYDRFSFDITDCLSTGGEQTIEVAVRDSSNAGNQVCGKQSLHPAGASYTTTSGIWQTVWMEPVSEEHISAVYVTPDTDAMEAGFRVVPVSRGTDGLTADIEVLAGGRTVLKKTGSTDEVIRVEMPSAELWSPENPFLYDYKVTLLKDGKAVDEVTGYFGMRKISVEKDASGVPRLMLNGKFVFQMGPLDQGFWPDGIYTAPCDEALKYDIDFVKSVGFNMIRKHVKIEPERWYYWADKLGVLVWQDFPCGQLRTESSRKDWEEEMDDYVSEYYNHPSIVMWVVFNEGWGQYDTPRIVNKVRSLDASRLVSNASGWYDAGYGDVIDKHFYPGPDAPVTDEHRAGVNGEFGGLGCILDDHVWRHDALWGYYNFRDRDSLATEYVKLWQRVHKLKRENGLSAAVYTQISDIEAEINGMMTYDRKVCKIDPAIMKKAHLDQFPEPEYRDIIPVSRDVPQLWKYTEAEPGEGWPDLEFDDSSWKEGYGAVGTAFGKDELVGIRWTTSDLWLRKEFHLEELNTVLISAWYGEDSDIYINGVLACRPEGFNNTHGIYELNREAIAALKKGRNVIAVHCVQRNKGGEQYIDIGLIEETGTQEFSLQAWKQADGPLKTRWAEDVTPDNAHPEYPRPTMVRSEWMNLNGLWNYAISEGESGKMPKPEGKILVPYPVESALSGVMKPLLPEETLWYERTFTVPEEWAGKRILLNFNAVDWRAQVFLNGRAVGNHSGGYDRFSFDITPFLVEGKEQRLTVAVQDPTDTGRQLSGKQTLHPAGAFYTATSGIWQTVWIEPVSESSICGIHIVPDAEKGSLKISVDASIVPGQMELGVKVLGDGKTVAEKDCLIGTEMTGIVLANLDWYKARNVWCSETVEIQIPDVRLWSPDSPYLYDIEVELRDSLGKVTDRIGSYAGVRSINIAKSPDGYWRPYLNGEELVMCGALEQGFWPDGIYTSPTDEALAFDVDAALAAGLNAVRKHIKIEPERYYYWADRKGLLILQDMPSGRQGDPYTDRVLCPEAAARAEMEMRTLIQQRWNHPSIIAWVMFNEGWGQNETLRHAAWAKMLDPSRLIDEASGFPRHGGGDIIDTHGGIAPTQEGKISLDSETAGYGIEALGHSWPGVHWATGTYDPDTGKEGPTDKESDHPLYPVTEESSAWYTKSIIDFYTALYRHIHETGSCGDFKVQLYDVEIEGNGLLSYDRAVWKIAPEQVKAAISNLREEYSGN